MNLVESFDWTSVMVSLEGSVRERDGRTLGTNWTMSTCRAIDSRFSLLLDPWIAMQSLYEEDRVSLRGRLTWDALEILGVLCVGSYEFCIHRIPPG